MIRVHIAASTPVARAGLEAVLRAQADFEVVAQEGGADVVIADLLPNDSVQYAPAAIVLLTDDPAPAWSAELLRGGIRAVLPHHATPSQIVAAVFAAAAGLAVVPVDDATAVLPESRAEQMMEPLTPRETQVLEMLAEGLINKEIATRLGISDHTAKFHVNSILAKLNASTRTEAVTRGIRSGLIMI
jgi:DNA-binding NarL/FixJ family response regulator